jgi:hypothetical protein
MLRLKFIQCHKLDGSGARWKDLTVFFILTFLSFLSFKNVFLNDGILAFEDLSPMYKFEQLYRPFDFPWNDKSNLGSPAFDLGNALYNIGLMAFSIPCKSVIFGHKLFFVFLLASSGCGFYLFSKQLTKSKLGAFLSSLYYMYNPWIFHHISLAHNTIFLGYAILPLALLAYFKSFEDKRFRSLFLSGLASTLLFLASFHISYLFFILIFLHAFIQALASRKNKSRLISSLTPAIGIFALTISFSFPILYHFYKVRMLAFAIWKETIAIYMPTPSLIDVAHLIIGASIVAASIALLKKEKLKPFLLSLCAFGMIFGFLGLKPLKPIFEFLAKLIPGFFIFRATNKFFLLPVIALALLLGWFPEKILSKQRSKRRFLKPALTVLLAFLVLSPSWHSFSGDYGGALKTVEIPKYYKELDDWLRNQKGDFRIAFFPPAVWVTEYKWAKHWFLDPAVALQAKPTIELRAELDATLSASFVRWVYTAIYTNETPYLGRLLGLLGVKYVIVRMDADMPEFRDDLRLFNLSNTLNIISNQRDLKFVRSFGPILVYENPYSLPHLFSSNKISLAVGDRRILTSLTKLESFSFQDNPIIFLDDSLSMKEMLSHTEFLIMDGNRRWDLILSWLRDSVYIIKPWDFAEPSVDIWSLWIKGDYAWPFLNGKMHIAPDNYIATIGGNSISIPFKINESDTYILIAQVFKSGDEAFKGIKFKVDGGNEVFIEAKSIDGVSRFEWIKIGEYSLNEGKHIIQATSVEASAISKIALIPSRLISKAEKDVLNEIQAMDVTPIHIFDQIHKSDFYIVKNGSYVLLIDGVSNAPEVRIDGEVIPYEAMKFSKGFWLASFKLNQGVHTVEAAIENRSFIMILYQVKEGEGVEAFPWLPKNRLHQLNYIKRSGSLYEVHPEGFFITFLEAYTDYWRLNSQRPLTAFGYANIFKIDKEINENHPLTLAYLGLTYVNEGTVFSILLLTIALGICLVESIKVKHEKRRYERSVP